MRLYTLIFENLKTGIKLDIGLKPMTHSQAVTMRSKHTNYDWRIIHIVEVL